MGCPWFHRSANAVSIRFMEFSVLFWEQINHCVVYVLQSKTGSLSKARKCLENHVHVVMLSSAFSENTFKNIAISLNVDFFFNKQDFFQKCFPKIFLLVLITFKQVGILWDCMQNLLETSLLKLSGKSTKHELFP